MAIANAINSLQTLNTSSSVTFSALNLSGLTASQLVATDGSKNLVSVSSLNTFITGTANQVIVTPGSGTVQLSLPQDIATTSGPTFLKVKLTPTTSFTAQLFAVEIGGATITYTQNGGLFDGFAFLSTNVLATGSGSLTNLQCNIIGIASPTKTGNGTFSTIYGLNILSIASIATSQYGGAFAAPTGGTVNQALYTDDLSIGFTTPSPPTSGMQVAGNCAFFGTGSFGSGTGVMSIINRSVAPSVNPTGGGILYASSGAGTWRGSSGTVTTFGPAEPHCPECGSDFGFEWENEKYGGNLRICALCFSKELGDRPYVRWNERKSNADS